MEINLTGRLYNLAIRAQLMEPHEGYMGLIDDYVALIAEVADLDEGRLRAVNIAAECLVAQIKKDKEKSEQS